MKFRHPLGGSTRVIIHFRDKGEAITWPSVADETLWDKYDAARATLFAATQRGAPAPRYGIA